MEAPSTNSTSDDCETVKASNVKNPKASTAARRVTFSPNKIMSSIVDDRIKRILEDTLGSVAFREELAENERILLLLQAKNVVDHSMPMEPFVLAMQGFGLLVPGIDLSRDMAETLYNSLSRLRREEQEIKRIVEDTLGSVTFREELAEIERVLLLGLAKNVVDHLWPMDAFVLAMQVPCIDLSRDMAETLYNSLTRLRDEEQIGGRDRAAAGGDGSGSAAGGSVAGSLGTVVRSDASSTLSPSPDRASVGVQAVVNDPQVQLPADAILEDPSSFVVGEPGMLADAGGDQAPRGEDDAQESLEGTAFVGSATSGSTGITNPQQARNSSTPNDSNSLAFSRSTTGGGGTGASTLYQEGGEA